MPRLFRHQLRHEGREYRLTVQFDDEAIMENKGKFGLLAEVKTVDSEEWISIAIDFQLIPEQSVIEVFYEKERIATIDLNILPEKFIDTLEGESTEPSSNISGEIEALESLLDGDVGASIAEKLIERFPTDPIIGCLVKGAASTLLGQTIRCWYPVRDKRPITELLWSIREYLQGHAMKMFTTFLWRSGWCAARVGW